MSYEVYFLQALALTILAEIFTGWIAIKIFPKYFSFPINKWKSYLCIAAASFMTLPYVWFIWPYFLHERLWYIAVSEVWVWLMEGFFYLFVFRINYQKAFLFSFLLNLCSFTLGLLIKF